MVASCCTGYISWPILRGDWDIKAADYRAWIELLRVQQLGFQRQGAMVHDNIRDISYTHRLETERHDLLMGRIDLFPNKKYPKISAAVGN